MKTKHHIDVMHVISEPGDATRYNYAYHKDDYVFYFMPIDNHFNYPQQIDYYEVKNVDTSNRNIRRIRDEDTIVITISERFNCNPCTVLECIRTMQEVMKGL